ncbi:Double-stranded RNA-binding domain [Macleaya cordata]|uniref:Double-stranded RNA-binding domain n=1 Tax=Macleaya cordata TaxID=56857 RepID=A0A200Q5Z7_MACCD|nr:Double-stranded RNA-binding domain [Macleaya cordata]
MQNSKLLQSLPEHLMHKNRLQEYAQRSAIPLPIYETINEGSQHAPKFRSTVKVDGAVYRSLNTFSHRKEAEQDVAKFAFEYISKKIKDERCPLIYEDTIFCKSILNEFAVKMNLEKPTYTTTQSEGLLPVFISSLVFDGKTYTGTAGRNKKDAEQLAARTVIQSILGTSGSGTYLSEIIKSKSRLYAALHKVEESQSVQETKMPKVVSPGNDCESSTRKRKEILNTLTSQHLDENVTVTPPPFHENKKPKEEVLCETSARPIGIVASLLDQPVGGCPDRLASEEYKPVSDVHLIHQNELINGPHLVQPSLISHGSQGTAIDISVGRKHPRGKNKKRRQKKIQNGEQLQMTPALTMNQAPSCSVTL